MEFQSTSSSCLASPCQPYSLIFVYVLVAFYLKTLYTYRSIKLLQNQGWDGRSFSESRIFSIRLLTCSLRRSLRGDETVEMNDLILRIVSAEIPRSRDADRIWYRENRVALHSGPSSSSSEKTTSFGFSLVIWKSAAPVSDGANIIIWEACLRKALISFTYHLVAFGCPMCLRGAESIQHLLLHWPVV